MGRFEFQAHLGEMGEHVGVNRAMGNLPTENEETRHSGNGRALASLDQTKRCRGRLIHRPWGQNHSRGNRSSMFSRAHTYENACGSAGTTQELLAACGGHKNGLRGPMVGELSSVPVRVLTGGMYLAGDSLDPFVRTGEGQAKIRFAAGAPMNRFGANSNDAVSFHFVFGWQGPVVPDLGRRVRDRGPPTGAENDRFCHN